MRIAVYPHDLGMGGSQLNAVEIAAGVAELGHEVIVVGRPGVLLERIAELGLEFVELPAPRRRPSRAVVAALRGLVDERGIEILHGYEWPPTLECELGAWPRPHVAVVSTVMSMAIPPFIPKSVDLTVGTAEIADYERRVRGRRRLSVLEPPVDLEHNRVHPAIDATGFRDEHALDHDRVTVVAVARFAHELKLEGTLTAIDVAADDDRIQLVLVGDGPARDIVEQRAVDANRRSGRRAVVLTGALADPRAAYAAADVSLGMGGSALRALAFGTPLVVQGENGFWRRLSPETESGFLWTGWYGVGSDAAEGRSALQAALEPLVADPDHRAELGSYGLDLVRRRFSLEHAAEEQERIYSRALAELPSAGERARGNVAGFTRYGAYYVARRLQRALGRERADDFNARPVTAVNARRQGRS